MEQIKARMTDYWTERVPTFSELRMRELSGKMRQRWMDEFEKYIPMSKPLKILDLGTGTGFFAFLLSARGHQVTGIDLTEHMIEEARRMAGLLDIPAEFFVMDAENPDFPPESFDVLVTRNLTWGLPHLETAYQNWHRLLKPNGILINFDADYCREKNDVPLPENHAHKGIPNRMKQEYEAFKEELRPTQQPRPQWDAALLEKAGFHSICVDEEVYKRIYTEFDEFYNPTPIFMITARAQGNEADK